MIDRDSAGTDGERMEVINPHTTHAVHNVNQFIAQYSAARDKDFRAIALPDMEAVLRGKTTCILTGGRKKCGNGQKQMP